MRRLLDKALAPLRRRVMLMVNRAVISLIDDEKSLQQLQATLLSNEVRNKIERFQDYGFSSVPLAGAQGLILCVGGNRDHAVAVSVDDRRYRKANMKAGEVAVYHKDGNFLHFKEDGTIEIKAENGLFIDTPLMGVTGDIMDRTSTGNILTIQMMRDIYNLHRHGENEP